MTTHANRSVRVRLARLASSGDADSYRRQLNAYASDPMGGNSHLTEDTLDRVLTDLADHPTARVFLAEADGQACGFATCFLGYSTFRGYPLMNIHDIAVMREWRGLGVGRLLLKTLAAQARREGCCKLTLEVREDNPAARALYESEGFRSAIIDKHQVQYLFLEKSI